MIEGRLRGAEKNDERKIRRDRRKKREREIERADGIAGMIKDRENRKRY